MASEYTPNYNLDLYVSTDKPNLRDQYNAAMGKIDTQMKTNADGITNANANVGTLQTQMSTANENIEALQTKVSGYETQIATALSDSSEALQTANQNKGDITTINGTLSTQGGEIDALQSTVGQHTSQIGSLQSGLQSANEQIAGKAATNHASANATYGLGTAVNYGHLKVTDTVDGTPASSAVAISPKGVQDAVNGAGVWMQLTFKNLHANLASIAAYGAYAWYNDAQKLLVIQGHWKTTGQITANEKLFDVGMNPSNMQTFGAGLLVFEDDDQATFSASRYHNLSFTSTGFSCGYAITSGREVVIKTVIPCRHLGGDFE